MTRYGPVELLANDHELESFDCGSEEHTTWLRRHARQAHQSDTAKVYVVCHNAERRVVGYYALTAGAVAHEAVPPRVTKGIGRYPVPVVILTRLGVDLSEQGSGLGTGLVRDALLQCASIAERAGVRALVVHAESERASGFYHRLAIGFEPAATDPLHLILLMKDLRQAIRDAARVGASSDGSQTKLGSEPAVVPMQPHARHEASTRRPGRARDAESIASARRCRTLRAMLVL